MTETITSIEGENLTVAASPEVDAIDPRGRLAVIGLHEVVIADQRQSRPRWTRPKALDTIEEFFPGQPIPDGFGVVHKLPPSF
jgi:hypothetical protein